MKNTTEVLADIVAEQFADQIFHDAHADGTEESFELPLHGGHFLCTAKISLRTEEQEAPCTPAYSNLEVTVYSVSFMDFEDKERSFNEDAFCNKLIEAYKQNLNIN